MMIEEVFSPDYSTARRRFLAAVERLGWRTETGEIDAVGPDGEKLAVDVGCSPDAGPENMLVVSSGLHGVEGFFGSAVQLALLERWAASSTPPVRCLFLHALNPYGFAWLRRFDECNVDPNRNFLLENEKYEGAPAGYAALDRLLNPRRPPSNWDPFRLKALAKVARHGSRTLRQSVAAGQYEYPQGLFFGGRGPSQVNQWLDANFARWLRGSQRVIHLDLHTGLGPMGSYKLLTDHPLDAQQQDRMEQYFGADSCEGYGTGGIAYDTRGGFGRWCMSKRFAPDYLYACVEFGTYRPIEVLASLRAENQAHHWSDGSAVSMMRAKQRLKEVFCPAAARWRTQVLEQSLAISDQALRGLARVDS